MVHDNRWTRALLDIFLHDYAALHVRCLRLFLIERVEKHHLCWLFVLNTPIGTSQSLLPIHHGLQARLHSRRIAGS